jgi:hypothetical protein
MQHLDSVINQTRTPFRRRSNRKALKARIPLTFPASLQQLALVALIIALTTMFARLGLGAGARLFFVAAALAGAAYTIRRSPWQYITLTFWFWTLTPLARRLIDYNVGFDPVNFVLATPNLMALFMVKDVMTSRDLLRRREALAGLFLLLPISYGLIVSLVQGAVIPGMTAAADWFAPLLYYFYILANWRRIRELKVPFGEFIALNGLFVTAYGLFQYFMPLPWDVEWVINSGMTSIGQPIAYGLRVFGTLNSPGVLAIWIGSILLLLLGFRTKFTTLLVPAAVLLLLVTLVRSVAGTVVLGVLLAGVMGRAGTFKMLGVAVLSTMLVGAGVAAVNPTVVDRLTTRFETLNSLSTDDSALTRAAIYAGAPALIAASPLGIGIGALGRGAVAGENADMVSIDSGPLVVYLALGWVGGSLYLAGVTLVLIQALVAARVTQSSVALSLAVAATAGAVNLVFSNMAGLFAAIVWTCAAYAAAIAIVAQEEGRASKESARDRSP